MDRVGCLSDEEIALATGGTFAPAERARFEAHMGACAPCRARWAEAHAPAPSPVGHPLDIDALAGAATDSLRAATPAPEFRRGRFFRVAVGIGAAAAAAFLVVWGTGIFSPEAGTRRERTLPEGRAIAGRGERIETVSSADVVRLPDGSRFRVAAGSAAMFDAPGTGERIVVRLARGTLEADVVKGAGLVRIVSGAGEISVVGTVFTAKAFSVYAGGEGGMPLLSVEVTEGAVEIMGAAGRIRVAAGRRGIVRDGETPVLQEAAPLGWREAARRWGGDWEKPFFASSWGAVTLLAGRWGGIDSWEGALDADGEPADLRRVAAALVGIAAGPDEAGGLKDRFKREADEGVRLALLPHITRLSANPLEWLAEVSGRDASAKVRSAASALSRQLDRGR